MIAQLRRARPVEELASPAHDLHCDSFRRRRANRPSFRKRTSNVEPVYNVDIEAAGRVQFGARGADSFRKRGFDIHVQSSSDRPHSNLPDSISFSIARNSLSIFLPFIDGYDLCLSECRGVRDRSCNIVSIEPPIERNRLAVALRDFWGGLVKSSRSHRQFGQAFIVTQHMPCVLPSRRRTLRPRTGIFATRW